MTPDEERRALLDLHIRGMSLHQPFYMDPGVFEWEMQGFLGSHWLIAGHVSDIPERGDYFVFEALGASIIVVRGEGGRIHALHNVCRHRGAQLCDLPKGRLSLLRCRYHGWTYRLDGSLAAWRHMPDGLSKQDFGLRAAAVFEFEGIVLVSLDRERAPDAAAMLKHTRPFWERYELANCQVAASRTYRIAANWKLAVENNLECYHCLPSHPEYTATNAFVRVDEGISELTTEQFEDYRLQWSKRLEFAGFPTGRSEFPADVAQACRAGTNPLAPGKLTGSRTGQGVAPLLGRIREYDESVTTGAIGFLSYVAGMCDYAVLVTYVPQTVGVTDVIFKWLVRRGARESVDYSLEELLWLWDETTKQDKSIIELNAAGVATRGYTPGVYSSMESGTVDFIERYIRALGSSR